MNAPVENSLCSCRVVERHWRGISEPGPTDTGRMAPNPYSCNDPVHSTESGTETILCYHQSSCCRTREVTLSGGLRCHDFAPTSTLAVHTEREIPKKQRCELVMRE
jgi:hypothetical protein